MPLFKFKGRAAGASLQRRNAPEFTVPYSGEDRPPDDTPIYATNRPGVTQSASKNPGRKTSKDYPKPEFKPIVQEMDLDFFVDYPINHTFTSQIFSCTGGSIALNYRTWMPAPRVRRLSQNSTTNFLEIDSSNYVSRVIFKYFGDLYLVYESIMSFNGLACHYFTIPPSGFVHTELRGTATRKLQLLKLNKKGGGVDLTNTPELAPKWLAQAFTVVKNQYVTQVELRGNIVANAPQIPAEGGFFNANSRLREGENTFLILREAINAQRPDLTDPDYYLRTLDNGMGLREISPLDEAQTLTEVYENGGDVSYLVASQGRGGWQGADIQGVTEFRGIATLPGLSNYPGFPSPSNLFRGTLQTFSLYPHLNRFSNSGSKGYS